MIWYGTILHDITLYIRWSIPWYHIIIIQYKTNLVMYGAIFSSPYSLFWMTEGLLGVVEDLAFATMFETGKLTPLNLKPIHLITMLNEVLEAAYTTDERGNVKDLLRLSIRCSEKVPPVVCADSSLQRILYNLVSNAMQFCSEKGEVDLAVHYSLPPPMSNCVPPPHTCSY